MFPVLYEAGKEFEICSPNVQHIMEGHYFELEPYLHE